jgi:TRAP-type C4-dicarboxylate transport system substrate-binding protein
LRIGSGHSPSNPWITALEDYFVKNVSDRVSKETNYEINWVKNYGGSVITLGNELQGVQDGLVDIGCTILVFEASRLPLVDMVYSMPFSCSDPLIVADVIKEMYKEYPALPLCMKRNIINIILVLVFQILMVSSPTNREVS